MLVRLFFVLFWFYQAEGFDIPEGIPSDWVQDYLAGNLLFSETPARLMPEVGNGYIASVVENTTIYAAGVFNGLGFVTPSHRARIPAFVVLPGNNMNNSIYALNLREAVFYKRSQVISLEGGVLNVEERWYASLVRPSLLVHEFYITNNGSASQSLSFNCSYSLPSTDFAFVNQSGNGYFMLNGSTLLKELPEDNETVVAMVSTSPDTIVIAPNSVSFVPTFNVIVSSLNSSDPLADALDSHEIALSEASELFSEHVAAWALRWEDGHVEVADNLPLAQVVNSSLYYIRSSIRSDWNYGLSPGGLASDGYYGHSFWDTETWMYPIILLFEPTTAKGLLQYRANRITQAFLKAQSFGYNGTMWPWESAFTGLDVIIRGAHFHVEGEQEIHINGDIVFALNQYWRVTGNYSWLETVAFPIVVGIADFWISRATSIPNSAYFGINLVQPPDEYETSVNNSVYTNVVASLSLKFAVEVSILLNKSYPPSWLDIAENLIVLFNETTQIHPEYEGYDGEIIKQPDVVLIGYPLNVAMPPNVRENDLNYYAPLTNPQGPTTGGDGMYAIGFLEVGNFELAAHYFSRAYANNVQAPFNVWQETPTGGTVNFITGAGGFLQSLVYGYGGVRITSTGLIVNPVVLPANTTFVKLASFHYLGSTLDLVFDNTTMTVELLSVLEEAPKLVLTPNNSASIPLNLQQPITIPLTNGTIEATSSIRRG